MRRHLQRLGRGTWRLLLWLGLFIVVAIVALLLVLGSESGSRWLLHQGLGMQKVLSARYQSGTFLSGLELADLHFRNAKMEIQVRRLLARWSLLHLLQAEIALLDLKAEGVDLHLLTPPTGKPTKLPLLVIPIKLDIQSAEITDIRLFNYGATKPLTLERLGLAGSWRGYKVELARLTADQAQLGHLALKGEISLRGAYPLFVQGRFDYRAFREKGWQPVHITLRRQVDDLDIELVSQGGLTANARGRLRPLEPNLPYSANLQWQALQLPWLLEQKLASKGGQLHVSGDKSGLSSLGQAQLSGRQLPAGQYDWKGRTNWHSAHIDSFSFNGLLGKLKASGDFSWQQGYDWKLLADFQQLDLARQWPVPHSVAPVMTGKLETKGRTNVKGSAANATLKLANGENWALQQQGKSWLWNFKSPQELKLQWKQVSRQLPGLEALHSNEGDLELRGSVDDYSLLLDTGLAGPKLPTGQWSGELSGSHRHVNVERLQYQGEAGEATLGGEADFGETIRWSGALVLGDFESAWLAPNWSGQFTGHLAGQGEWGKARRLINIEDGHINGSLRGQPLLLDGPLYLQVPASGWPRGRTPGLQLAWGSDRLQLKGGLEDAGWNLNGAVQFPALSVLGAGLQGSINGTVALQGEERRPDVLANLLAEKLGAAGFRAKAANLQMRLARLGEADSSLSLLVDGVTNSAGRSFGQLGLEASGKQSAHRLQWQAGTETVYGQGSLSGRFEPETLSWEGQIDTGQLSLPQMDWLLSRAVAVVWDGRAQQLTVDPHCWVSQEAKLCNVRELLAGKTGSAELELTGLAASRLTGLLPEGLALTGDISGHAEGGWEPGQRPHLKGGLLAEKGAVVLARDEPAPPLELPYRKVELAVEAADVVSLRFDLDSDSLGQGHMAARIDPYDENRSLSGTLALQGLRLDVLQPFFPAIATLNGNVAADGRLQGTLARPEFWGSLQLDKGELGLHRLPVNMNDISLRADVRGNTADLSGELHSGKGLAKLEGRADWATEKPVLDLSIKGERFELKQEPQLRAEIDPDLRLHVVPGQLDLSGQIVVPSGELNLKPLTDKATPLSSDVRIVSTEEGDRAKATVTVSQWLINADVLVRLGDDVYFHGYGVNGRLIGAMRLRQQGRRALEANGEVELDKDSRYDAYGQRLLIRRGRLIFAGNLTQPGLDVEAVREVDSQVVGVRVEGRANAPEVSFFSDNGGLSQEEILSYLVLGRPLDTSSGKEGPNLSAAAAAIKLGATGGAGLTSQLGDTVGITDLAVDAEGTGDDTQVTVSGYLSPKLYLRYGVGIFTPVNTATIRYKINSKLYLEAVSSLDSAIDLFYNLKF
ncbi:MAG: translocation/assembly module TamB domain-containing protein [Pedobacter sp.]|nr:translocation/assembly module TamB domain-containing protein [Pedobacter sp.]